MSEKLIKLLLAFSFITEVAFLIMLAVAVYNLILHPEVIGAFFGKIVSGFQSTK